MARILIADDEAGLREFMGDALRLDDHDVAEAVDGRDALRQLEARSFDLVITDLRMPHVDGMTVVRKLRAEQPETEVIVLTAHGRVDSAVEAMKLGAFDYLDKPIASPDALRLLAARAIERRRLRDARDRSDAAAPALPPLTYGDPAMAAVVTAMEKVARTSASVLLLGETGSGKEVAARTIHAMSERRGGPFMAVNCAALSETLLESELFGHEKGAFTGADRRKVGFVEAAAGGTLFLDEIGEMPPSLQPKLLRVLEQRVVTRVGGTTEVPVDIRLIAATHRNLEDEVRAGRFREDLYFRISTFTLAVPPLRDRRADIVPLCEHFIRGFAGEHAPVIPTLTHAARELVLAYPWPGNVRELRNAIERAMVMQSGGVIDVEHLPERVRAGAAAPVGGRAQVVPVGDAFGVRDQLADVERAAIVAALDASGGNQTHAAARLGLSRRALIYKLEKYGLKPPPGRR